MRYRRGTLHWYDFVFVLMAFLVVYPDTVLTWLSEKVRKPWGWRHLIAYEVLMIGGLALLTILLMESYPKLYWWRPAGIVAALALYRWLMWLVAKAFHFDD